ncbi:MAG: ABC transporter ATP-binding protein/permease [Microthrixaceae bacterium]|nr:ABC transporter ATP-binding protein/permease [Microthrixaceae bacterium]
MHPVPFALSIVGGVGWAVMIVVASIVLGRVTDEVIQPAFSSGVDAGTVWWAVAALVAVGALRGLAVVLRRWFGSVTEARMQRSLRTAVADRLLEMPMGSYRDRPTGQLLSTSDVDVTTATQMLMPLPFSLGVVALVAVSLVSLWFADPWFAVVALLLFPALAWLSRYYTRRIHEPAARVQQNLGRVAAIAHESFDGVMAVKTLARERPERERFDSAPRPRRGTHRGGTDDLDLRTSGLHVAQPRHGHPAARRRRPHRRGWLDHGGRPGAGCGPVRLAGLPDAHRRLPVPVDAAGGGLDRPGRRRAVRARGSGLRHEGGSAGRPCGADDVPAPGPLSLAVDSVDFSHAGRRILHDVTFDARPGEVLAVVGSTGSGKSTLVSLLAHLDTRTRARSASVVWTPRRSTPRSCAPRCRWRSRRATCSPGRSPTTSASVVRSTTRRWIVR